MDISSSFSDKHSVDDFIAKFGVFVDSAAGIVHVRANESLRASQAIKTIAIGITGVTIKEWDVVNGFRTITPDNISNPALAGDGNIDLTNAFEEPLRLIREGNGNVGTSYFIYHIPSGFTEGNAHFLHMLRTYNEVLPSTSIVVVLLTPDVALPGVEHASLLSLVLAPPSISELMDSLSYVLDGFSGIQDDRIVLSEADKERICYTGVGLHKTAFETYLALAAVDASKGGKEHITVDDFIKGVSIGKTDVVNSNDLLELYQSTSMSEVGGLENLKQWVDMRKDCYSDEAADFGVEPPKGIVLVGIPGTGKSLVAKAISSVLGVPLVRLDFGRVFNMMLGESEKRIRTALRMVEDMSPVVLFVDEIDKGLGGIGSGGDSGVSSRVLGTFLTWLQECNKPVFTLVTANNVSGLPPELLRRGRFDGIFYTTLPNAAERREVFRIHLQKRKRDIDEWDSEDVQKLINIAAPYVPAEIESAVKDALVVAYSKREELTVQHIIDALSVMVPLSKSFASKIAEMDEWAKHNATPAGGKTVADSLVPAKRRMRPARVLN